MGDQAGVGARHAAWFYAGAAQRAAAVAEFTAAGVAAGQPVLVAVPRWRVPPGLAAGRAGVTFADMAQAGRNPARVLALVREFADRCPGGPVRVLAEPAWPGRSAAELCEVARCERLFNLAFPAGDVLARCLYSTAELPGRVLAAACATHPLLHRDGAGKVSSGYRAGPVRPSGALRAPPGARAVAYGRDLRPVRALVGAVAARAGLPPDRCTDLVIAASEVAANTLRHTGGGGVARIWAGPGEVVCQLEDGGYIADPLAGQFRPPPGQQGGRGLWLVNQVCDLAQIRTSGAGTTIRLHMRTGCQAGLTRAGAAQGGGRAAG